MHDDKKNKILQSLSLGKQSDYNSAYDPNILQAVPRSLNREELGIVDKQPFFGCDVWHAYEMSWLNNKGKPVVAVGRIFVPFDTPNIIESKSLKLYLNGFNQSRFDSEQMLVKILTEDLSAIAQGLVSVELFSPENYDALPISKLPGKCIDLADIEILEYDLNPSVLKLAADEQQVDETLHSHLLKSNCLVTNQPDWASLIIAYQGQKINHIALLRYLISFRMHNEFHEQCVERIFMDIFEICSPKSLTVQALYTRRGGLDINPFRSTEASGQPTLKRTNRQ